MNNKIDIGRYKPYTQNKQKSAFLTDNHLDHKFSKKEAHKNNEFFEIVTNARTVNWNVNIGYNKNQSTETEWNTLVIQ